MNESPTEIAAAYTEALESQADDAKYEAVRERLDGLQERLERFGENYGESTLLLKNSRRRLSRQRLR